MRERTLLLLVAAATLAAQGVSSNNDRIWKGVYTTAQAERGKAAFDKSCSNCHNKDLNGSDRAPSLRGDRFMGNWLNGSVNALYSKIRFSMPATYPETVADDVKLDVLTYLLQVNAFPVGASELKMDADDLESIQIVKQGSQEIPNFALVEVVGCLAQNPGGAWILARTSQPMVTREETSTAEALKEAANKALGDQTFVLVSIGAFHPEAHKGQEMEARGLVYREPKENRLNLTSLQALLPSRGCGN